MPIGPCRGLRRGEGWQGRYQQLCGWGVGVALDQGAAFGRPEGPVSGRQQLQAHRTAVRGPQQHRNRVRGDAQRGLDGEPAVTAGYRVGEGDVQIQRDLLAVTQGDEIDVLAESAIGKVRAGQRRAADEVDAVTELPTEEC